MTSIERDWARLGVLFNVRPAPSTPDPERLLLETARQAPRNPRLIPLAVTWLGEHGGFVARHRLKRLSATELHGDHQPVLGLILSEAVAHGAPRELLVAAEACRAAVPARPLAEALRAPRLTEIAERHASALSRRWGVLTPPVETKPDAVRPGAWILDRNPALRGRIVRKGDLRCSILETLRLDTSGAARSAAQLARLCAVTRSAAAKALDALVREGEVVIRTAPGRDHPVTLRPAA